MINFKRWKQNYNRKCVMFVASDQTQADLTAWCKSHGFDLSKSFSGRELADGEFNFHLTVICSENEVFMDDKTNTIKPLEIKPISFQLLGQYNDVPVLHTETSEQMLQQRKFFEDFYSMYDKWPSWKTHVTLSYNWTGTPALSSLTLPNFPLMFDKIKVSKMD